MRFACLLVEHLPIRVECLRQPELAAQPLVLLRAWDQQVLDASPSALAAGLGPGDSRRRVEQLCPAAVCRLGQDEVYQASHDQLRAVAGQFAAAVETAAWGELYLEIGGLARTFPSERALGLTLARQADQFTSLEPAVGIAANKFTALQAARAAALERSRVVVVPDRQESRFLASLPLSVLPGAPVELLRRLHLFGLTTLGGVAKLPHAAFTLQFGPEQAVFHDLARGLDPRPLAAQAPPPSLTRRRVLSTPLADRLMLLLALERLAGRLAADLSGAGYHAMALSLLVTTAAGQTHAAGAPLKPPSADPSLLGRVAGRLLGKLPLNTEVGELALTAYPLREWHVDMRQLQMFSSPMQGKLDQLRAALDQLRRRFGEWVVRLASLIGAPLPLPIRVELGAGELPTRVEWGGWSRPVDQLYESWRERRGWWDVPVKRDYYQVELAGEFVVTLFKDQAGRWFLDRRRQ